MSRSLPIRGLAVATALMVTALLVTACESIKVIHDSDPDADFALYQTWAWISEDNLISRKAGEVEVSFVSPIDEQRIRKAVESDLASKGYREVEAGEGQLIVSFTIGTQEKTQVYSAGSPGYPGYYGYGYGGWYGGSPVQTRQYTMGTLSLQFFDRASKDAVWVGWGSKRVSPRDNSDQTIGETVAKILASFPARP